MNALTEKQLKALRVFHALQLLERGNGNGEIAETYLCARAECTSHVFKALAEHGLLTRSDRKQRGLHNVVRYRLTLAGRCVLGLPVTVSYEDLKELATRRREDLQAKQAVTAELVNGELVVRIPFPLPGTQAQEKAQVVL